MSENLTKDVSKTEMATNCQRHAFQLTINNPEQHGYTHHAIKEKLVTNFTTLRFFCMADEIGENGTPHTHVYVYFNSRVRFSTIKKHFPETHIEVAHGTAEANVAYIKKSGKWETTDKAETKVTGTYEEWGEMPVQSGKRSDMEMIYNLVLEGCSNAEIIAQNHDIILNIEKIDLVRQTILLDKYKDTRRPDLKVIYISGATGTGKTRGVLDTHGDSNVYRVTDYQHGFDGYACQPVIAFDEFRNSLRFSDMLQYCDIYPIQLPARYTNKFACYETVYIISNWALEEQYPDVQREHPSSWKAFLRRISEVRTYAEDGTITVYPSVKEYLERDTKFHPVTTAEQLSIPFADGQNDISAE